MEIEITPPQSTDGMALNDLVQACPPLDGNSIYCNLLQCTHFQDTCICAKLGEELVGFVSAYVLPSDPNTLFVWQVAVGEQARGQGLAQRMILALLERPACGNVTQIDTTITPSNKASQALFTKVAGALSAPVRLAEGFDRKKHFNNEHESEQLWHIGPIPKVKTRLLI